MSSAICLISGWKKSGPERLIASPLETWKRPLFLVNGAPYWGFGYDPENFPQGLFDDPAVMTIAQERAYYDQVKEIEDDFVPYLMPWLGTGILALAFGCQIDLAESGPRRQPVSLPSKNIEGHQGVVNSGPGK